MSSRQKWKIEAYLKDAHGWEVDQIFISPGPEMRKWINHMWYWLEGGSLHLRVTHNASGAYVTARIRKWGRGFTAELPHANLTLAQSVADMKKMLHAKKNT